ncbi:MAG: hypothetical protein ACYDCO_18445 [Armatimonadota bacterium]
MMKSIFCFVLVVLAAGLAAAQEWGKATETLEAPAPAACLIEATCELPNADGLAKSPSAKLEVGPAGQGQITASVIYNKSDYSATLSGVNAEGKPASITVKGDTRPSVLRELEPKGEHAGWEGKIVTLGLALMPGGCRLFINGVQATELATAIPAERPVALQRNGVKLQSLRVMPGLPPRYHYLSGFGAAMLSGGSATRSVVGASPSMPQAAQLNVNGVPMLANWSADGLAVLDLAAERYRGKSWSEGEGFLRAPVPTRPYAAAYLLVHRKPGARAAMGFGLRVHEMSAAELKNIYLDGRPSFQPDQGVTVKPVPSLGPDWFQVRVPLNPAALQWYTHDKDGTLHPIGKRTGIEAYFCRPWLYGSTPRPDGAPSGLAVAAVTLEEAGIDLTVTGNGLGNVYAQPEQPKLTAAVRNLTGKPLTVNVTCDLYPYARKASSRSVRVKLQPGEVKSLDALAQPVREIGHYRVRVTADAGAAGRIDYRTNAALVLPDTRKKVDSPFGVWGRLWTDNSTEEQSAYLKKLAGIGFWMGKDAYDIRMSTRVPDDATAEELINKVPKEAKILMLGWEHTWSMEQTFAFPRLISEGKFEEVSPEVAQKMDDLAAEWRRLAKAARKLRPDLKISLGNSAVNYTAAFLERGFKPGVEFDYWGTEEGIFNELPEAPADAVGNINWWTKAISAHYGSKDVPLFKSECIYYATGPGFSRISESDQAAYYPRTYLLGLPYDSIYGFTAAMVDSSNSYIYSIWGMSGYCHQAPECSPKLSYSTYSALTHLLDGAKYDGCVETGTTSLYALRFRRSDGSKLYALWNLRGKRKVMLTINGAPQVYDALNRPVKASVRGGKLSLTLSEMPTYLTGAVIDALQAGENIPQSLPSRTLLGTLDNSADWTVDAAPDTDFEAPREWRGVPKVQGDFTVATTILPQPSGGKTAPAMIFQLQPRLDTHGLIPRYISLTARPGKEITIPAGTTRLGLWVYGNSTWAQVKLGVKSKDGNTRLILADDLASQMADNFDGWRFLDTGYLADDEFQSGQWSINRIVVTMPEQQVYVDDLLTTKKPQIAVWGVHAVKDVLPAISYQPW